MLRRILPHVAPADEWWVPSLPGWLGIAFTFEGLKALGVPQASLDSFPIEFREGMAARAAILHDFGANGPDNWEHPFGTPDVHVALALYAKDDESLQKVLELARMAHHDLWQISVVYRMQFGELPEGRNPFGFKDGLHNPHVEGSGPAPHAGAEPSIKAGEFILGYPDEYGEIAPRRRFLSELRHNGTFVAFRKFHMDVAAFRRYLRAQASSPEEEELLAAKMVGRWRSGAPLVLAPDRDDPELGSDRNSNNVFSYADDMKGLKCPFSAHIRRVNPRDALKDEVVAVNLHHFLRRGTNYGPPLPEGVLEDDGAERGGVFLLIGTHLRRQFEFIQSQWATDGNFISHGTEQDPLIGNNDGDGDFTIPAAAGPTAPSRPAAVRHRARRRILLHPRAAGAALARGSRLIQRVTIQHNRKENAPWQRKQQPRPEPDQTLEKKIQRLRELYATRPGVGKTALENPARRADIAGVDERKHGWKAPAGPGSVRARSRS